MVELSHSIRVKILGRKDMLKTIALGSSISVQGIFVRKLPDGRIVVKDNNTSYSGKPVSQTA